MTPAEIRERSRTGLQGCRADFPSLKRTTADGCPLAFFDGPAGTQTPRAVIDAVSDYYLSRNANTEGRFVTSRETDEMLTAARRDVAAFLGAPSGREISFGANMTTLAYSLAHALQHHLEPGDEVVITELEHEANRGPWLGLSRGGVVVREVRLRPEGVLDYDHFESLISSRTRLIALGTASNALGTINDVERVARLAAEAGSWLLLDAVHSAPHLPTDVRAAGADFLLCSAYKFFGPHIGILYSRPGLLEELETDRLRTQKTAAPERIETGTLNHAAIAGTRAAVHWVAELGDGAGLRERMVDGMKKIGEYEHSLACLLDEGLRAIGGLRMHGPPIHRRRRTPTISFTLDGRTPREVARSLGEEGLLVWDGDFFAARPMEVLGLAETGGVVRVGISPYNTAEEVERLVEAVTRLAG